MKIDPRLENLWNKFSKDSYTAMDKALRISLGIALMLGRKIGIEKELPQSIEIPKQPRQDYGWYDLHRAESYTAQTASIYIRRAVCTALRGQLSSYHRLDKVSHWLELTGKASKEEVAKSIDEALIAYDTFTGTLQKGMGYFTKVSGEEVLREANYNIMEGQISYTGEENRQIAQLICRESCSHKPRH